MTVRAKRRRRPRKPISTQQHSYHAPLGMVVVFAAATTGDLGTELRGAMMIAMALADMPEIRDRAVRLANRVKWREVEIVGMPGTMPAEVAELREYVLESIGDRVVAECVQAMPAAEKVKLLQRRAKRDRRGR